MPEGLTASSPLLSSRTLGGSFEWAEDFPLLPPPGPPLCFSRFSVSPALETPGPPARAPDARPAGTVLQILGPASPLPISLCPHLSAFACLSPSLFLPSLSDCSPVKPTHPTLESAQTKTCLSDGLGESRPCLIDSQFPFCKDPLLVLSMVFFFNAL